MHMGFSRQAVEAVGDNWAEIERLNDTLERLRRRRQSAVSPTGKPKVAWKIVVFQRAILYRVVMLADGCAAMWNSGNALGSILCARALFESAALLLDFQTQMTAFCGRDDLDSVDTLVMNRTFATKLKGWYEQEGNTEAVNVLTFVE
jgi:hypothetical protein